MRVRRSGTVESFPPPAHLGPGSGVLGRIRFAVRRLADLQTFTVVRDISPWLRERSGVLLEVGCGDQPYRHLVPQDCRYLGLDIAATGDSFGTGLHPEYVHYAGGNFPFSEASVDAILHTETLEHVANYVGFLAECARVLRPGGEMCFTMPFQARFHYIPHDYWRFTPTALKMITEQAGFGNVRVTARGNDVVVASHKALGVCYRVGSRNTALLVLLAPIIVVLLAVSHWALWMETGSGDDCLGYTVFARCEIKPHG